MIYPSDFENRIGFAPIRDILSDKCTSDGGRELVKEMKMQTDFHRLHALLMCAAEMKGLLERKENFPAETIADADDVIDILKAEGGVATASQLKRLRDYICISEKIKAFFDAKNANGETPNLVRVFSAIPEVHEVVGEIDRIIDKFGNVKDSASPVLANIRKSIRQAEASLAGAVRKFMASAVSAGIVDKDTAPVMRDGKLVVPIAAATYKAVKGVVHDRSTTGKTVFIEPLEVIEAGNRIRELELEEKEEINVILRMLSESLRPYMPQLKQIAGLMANFDFLCAKALFALEIDGNMPVLHQQIELEWYHAVHPILLLTLKKQNREVVPLDIMLTPEQKMLIISGPNAGGKSVSLKTIGCVQYMLQCALLPPLYSNSHAGIFKSMMIDIGDQQSLENDLSTYSSHLRNMKTFLRSADSSTLILADEIGSGTEPQIGGAIAQAILDELGKKQCFGVVTTHYQNLKLFADSTPGFVNGAMLYDRQHLSPTFKLSVGSAGSSFALEIARNIGLPVGIVDKAKEIVGSDYVNIDKYMLDIARDKRYWANKRMSIREKEHKLQKSIETVEQMANDLKSQRSELLKSAKQEASEMIKEANARVERTIHEIRKADAEKEQTKRVREELEQYRRNLQTHNEDKNLPSILKIRSRQKKTPAHREKPVAEELKVGDYVALTEKEGISGHIISLQGDRAEVAFGGLRTFVKTADLKKSGKPKTSAPAISIISTSGDGKGSRDRNLNFKTQLDVRGMRVDEALQSVMYFIDDAVQFSAGRVRILHGTGTGALREAIRGYLQNAQGVARFADEDVRFGGAGITVVELT